MRMKSTPWLLVSGLLVMGSALAADPATPQVAAPQTSSLKIAIDPVTGKRRPLTEAESAALDVQSRQLATAKAQAKVGKRSASAMGLTALPLTIEESMANAKTVDGITGFKPTEDMMSSMQVTRNADGTLTIQHSDVSNPGAAAKVEEAASE